jgi:hypothetical protein
MLTRELFQFFLAALLISATACKKDVALEAVDSDANGYLCLKCGAKATGQCLSGQNVPSAMRTPLSRWLDTIAKKTNT